MTEPSGVWVYAVSADVAAQSLGELRGVGDEPVRGISSAGLTAIAGDVPLAEFGESALRRNLEDLAWLEATARAHHHVIDALGQRGPLVPMRLATVYANGAGVAAMLDERATDLRAALSRISAHQEWGVKAYAQQSEPGSPAAAEPARSGAARAGPGASYLRRRRDELSAHSQARHDAIASAEAVHIRLSGLAAEARLHPPQAPQLTGIRSQMLLNAAYLLDEERAEEFADAVTALAREHPGVRLELTGPWPPYSFAGLPDRPDYGAGERHEH
jgi:Gas vesicle synthesis protein GvpL/GvpF